jgi:hypothetical protein
MTLPYTEEEQRLLNQVVTINQAVVFGGEVPTLVTGDRATIIDFGRKSGDPIVYCDRTEHEYVVPWMWIDIEEQA